MTTEIELNVRVELIVRLDRGLQQGVQLITFVDGVGQAIWSWLRQEFELIENRVPLLTLETACFE